MNKGIFPDELKNADIKNEKENCRPVSILPVLSKSFES